MNAFPIQAEAALVSWDPSDCGLDAARAAFTAAGFEDVCPKGRTEYEALKEAMATLKAILGNGLEDLEKATQDAQTAAMIAAMKAMAEVAV
jgi:hypothetical protein